MSDEINHNVKYENIGKWSVSSELFLDLVFNSQCNCGCDFCIARTPKYCVEEYSRWKKQLFKTLDTFSVKDIIILGGEATLDVNFFEKLCYLEEVLCKHGVDNVILTTNGIKLRDNDFLSSVISSCITGVNVSYMNNKQDINDRIFKCKTLTHSELSTLYNRLHACGKDMRLNVNVYKGNCDTVKSMYDYLNDMYDCADAIKFSPLMCTGMFGTVKSVRDYTEKVSMTQDEINSLYDKFTNKLVKNGWKLTSVRAFGIVDYNVLKLGDACVILKYSQVEDKYDLSKVIPTLKLYNNGSVSNEWDFNKNIL